MPQDQRDFGLPPLEETSGDWWTDEDEQSTAAAEEPAVDGVPVRPESQDGRPGTSPRPDPPEDGVPHLLLELRPAHRPVIADLYLLKLVLGMAPNMMMLHLLTIFARTKAPARLSVRHELSMSK